VVETSDLSAISNISTSADSHGYGSVEFRHSSRLGGWSANAGMELFAAWQLSEHRRQLLRRREPRGVADSVAADGELLHTL